VVKIGAKIVSHGGYTIFQMAEVAVPRVADGRASEGKPDVIRRNLADLNLPTTPARAAPGRLRRRGARLAVVSGR
jgi:hypothetical protein